MNGQSFGENQWLLLVSWMNTLHSEYPLNNKRLIGLIDARRHRLKAPFWAPCQCTSNELPMTFCRFMIFSPFSVAFSDRGGSPISPFLTPGLEYPSPAQSNNSLPAPIRPRIKWVFIVYEYIFLVIVRKLGFNCEGRIYDKNYLLNILIYLCMLS